MLARRPWWVGLLAVIPLPVFLVLFPSVLFLLVLPLLPPFPWCVSVSSLAFSIAPALLVVCCVLSPHRTHWVFKPSKTFTIFLE